MTPLSKQHFWDWFKRHNQEYLDLKNRSKKDIKYWLNELNTHLRAYFKCLGYAMEWHRTGTVRLVITVNGKARHFRKADDLVAKAPVIPGWEIIALDNPRDVDFMLDKLIMKSGIDPRELRFSLDGGVLTVYHYLCRPENEEQIAQLASLAAYNLLGERSYGTHIDYVEVANTSTVDTTDLQDFEFLPESVGGGASMVIDNRGRLICI